MTVSQPLETTAGPTTETVGAASYYSEEALANLAVLEERVREDIETTSHAHSWVPEVEGTDYNVLIIGGGQAGLGAAFALKRENLGKIQIFEAGTEGGNGCWINYARMHTLRRPKHMKGIELDVPSLHIRRWFEAVYGAEAWNRIKLVPRLDWYAYLRWYEKMTEAPVQYGTKVTATISTPDGDRVEDFDFVISATGYKVDLTERPELAEFLDDILLWEEVYAPSASHPMGKNPYLGDGFQFTARDASKAPYLNRLYHFSTAARASMGVTGNQLSGIYGGIKRIGWSVSRDVTRENWGGFMESFRNFEALEIGSVGPHTGADGWFPQTNRYGEDH